MKKVFFGCSMRGGQAKVSREELAKFPQMIQALGYTLPSTHQTEEGIVEREQALTTTHIHDRDYEWLLESRAGVFEITNSSIGAGGEISDMLSLGKPVLCLYKKSEENSVSAYCRGKKGSRYVKTYFDAYGYEDVEDAKNKIKSFLEHVM